MKKIACLLIFLTLLFDDVYSQSKNQDTYEIDDGLLANKQSNLVYSGTLTAFLERNPAQGRFTDYALLIYYPDSKSYSLSFVNDKGEQKHLRFTPQPRAWLSDYFTDDQGNYWLIKDHLHKEGQISFQNLNSNFGYYFQKK